MILPASTDDIHQGDRAGAEKLPADLAFHPATLSNTLAGAIATAAALWRTCPSSARWAAATLAAWPPQISSAGCCRARPKENVRAHGSCPPRSCMAARWRVACSGDCPPDKNATPGTAAGTVRSRQVRVASAAAWGSQPRPAPCQTSGACLREPRPECAAGRILRAALLPSRLRTGPGSADR
jgi:hypothetical protein